MGVRDIWKLGIVALSCCACRSTPMDARPSFQSLAPVGLSGPVASRVVGVERPRRPRPGPGAPRPSLLLAAMVLPGRALPTPLSIRGARTESEVIGATEVLRPARQDPGWTGFRLEVGVGQAPYDDTPPPNALIPVEPSGFSDSLMRLVIEEPVSGGISLLGGVAATRFLDEPILDGLGDSDLAWVSFGIQFRF